MIKSIKRIRIATQLFFIPYKNTFVSTLFNSIGIPFMMMIFLWLVTSQKSDSAITILCGSSIMGVISMSVSTLSVKINNLVISDGLEFFLSYGIRKFEFIIAILLSGAILYFFSNIIVITVGIIIFDIKITFTSVLFHYILYFLFLIFSLFPVGAIIGFKALNYNSAISISSIVTYGLVFLSPIYFETSVLPDVLQKIVVYLPTTAASNILKTILENRFLNIRDMLVNYSVLFLWGILGLLVFNRLVKWTLN